MSYDTAIGIGVDIIAPAVTLFTFWYGLLRPWHQTHIGRAVFFHCLGSMLLFDMAFVEQFTTDDWPGKQPFLLFTVLVWVVGWVYMDVALWLTRGDKEGP